MKKFSFIVLFLLFGLIGIRIIYVNVHARLPEIRRFSQEGTLEYRGNRYSVQNVTLWSGEDYYNTKEELQSYMSNDNLDEICILEVSFKVSCVEKENVIEPDIFLQCAYNCQGIDPFMFQELNSDLVAGEFHSGGTIVIPYCIYRENLSNLQWEQVVDGTMQYKLIFGTYPVKNEILITQIEKVKR